MSFHVAEDSMYWLMFFQMTSNQFHVLNSSLLFSRFLPLSSNFEGNSDTLPAPFEKEDTSSAVCDLLFLGAS